MNLKHIPLFSPTRSVVVGFLTTSGGVCPVTCKFSRRNGENFFFFEVPQGTMDQVASDNGDRVFVDEDGKHWSSAEVMWESTPRGA